MLSAVPLGTRRSSQPLALMPRAFLVEAAEVSLPQVAEGEVEEPSDDGGEVILGGAELPGPRLSSRRRKHSRCVLSLSL